MKSALFARYTRQHDYEPWQFTSIIEEYEEYANILNDILEDAAKYVKINTIPTKY